MNDLLTIQNLTVSFPLSTGVFHAVNDVTLSLPPGSVTALVGESGSGKSITALSIMRLVPPPGIISSGTLVFQGTDLSALSEEEMRSIRGNRIAMIFQEPMTSLNPVLTISDQLCEPLCLHRKLSRQDACQTAIELLKSVGIAAPESRMSDYPHQLSGGMRQRVMIAMALACQPQLLIADEPTTALDVTIQAQILELLDRQRSSRGLAILLITHDLGIVAERADYTAVMYAGQIVESAPTAELLSDPRHPYTHSLLAALPQNAVPGMPLTVLDSPATLIDPVITSGCCFAKRCPHANELCSSHPQQLCPVSPTHKVRCHKIQ